MKTSTYGTLAAVVLFLGCSSHVPPAEEFKSGLKPTEAEAAVCVQKWVAINISNPASAIIRNLTLVRPYRMLWGMPPFYESYLYGWAVMFDIDLVNSDGKYAGFKRRAILVTTSKTGPCPGKASPWRIPIQDSVAPPEGCLSCPARPPASASTGCGTSEGLAARVRSGAWRVTSRPGVSGKRRSG